MEMGFASSSLAANAAPAAQDAACAPLDWHSLKSRFVVAHALRRELAEAGDSRIAGGSFMHSGAEALAALRAATNPVNLTASGNGKTPSAMFADVTGTPTPMTEENYD